MYEIQEMQTYTDLREKHMLEGILAYLYGLAGELDKVKSPVLDKLKEKITDDAEFISGRLASHLYGDIASILAHVDWSGVAEMFEAERSETSQTDRE